MNQILLGMPLIDDEEISMVSEVLKSKWILNGPMVERFEDDFRNKLGVPYSAAVTCCTTGMHLAFSLLNIGEGDEVLLSGFNFIGGGLTVLQNNAYPVFVDIDPVTFNIDADQIEEKITTRTKAIFVLHYAGMAANMDKILELAEKHNLYVIEDAAHSLGSEYKGRKIGTLGDITVFSFGPMKAMTTAMGGMVVCKDEDNDKKVRVLRSYGMDSSVRQRIGTDKPWFYEVNELGHNFRMTDISAAIGIVQLKKLDSFISKRRELSFYLTKLLKDVPGIHPPVELPECKHSFLYYVIKVEREHFNKSRDELALYLRSKGVNVSVHWDPPLHLHPLFKKYNYNEGRLPISEAIAKQVLTLPMYPGLSREDIEKIAFLINEYVTSQ
jgi:dTDP-4-amino-4,6-dideoxygalactose transaminase